MSEIGQGESSTTSLRSLWEYHRSSLRLGTYPSRGMPDDALFIGFGLVQVHIKDANDSVHESVQGTGGLAHTRTKPLRSTCYLLAFAFIWRPPPIFSYLAFHAHYRLPTYLVLTPPSSILDFFSLFPHYNNFTRNIYHHFSTSNLFSTLLALVETQTLLVRRQQLPFQFPALFVLAPTRRLCDQQAD